MKSVMRNSQFSSSLGSNIGHSRSTREEKILLKIYIMS